MQSKQPIDMSIVKVADFVSQHHGEDPLNAVVAFAAKHFKVDYVHIALLEGDGISVKVVAGYLDDKPIEPGYVYALPGTPCEHVVEHDHKCYSEHVRELFPEDHDLIDLDAEGYIGEPINDAEGNAIGLIVLVNRKPLTSTQTLASSIRILAGYVSNVITANKIRDKLRLERDKFLTIMQTVDVMIVLLDLDGTIRMINKKGYEVLGYEEGELKGKDWFMTCLPKDDTIDTVRAVYTKIVRGDLEAIEYFENEVLTKTGERLSISWHNSILYDSNGTIIGGLSAGNDITERKKYEQQLEHLAHYDALTGLPNRLLLADRLQQAMIQSKRYHKLLAIAYLDLDGFKAVNDTHGHDIGDHLLISISKRLKKVLREGDTLSRLGGDEFVLILVDFNHYKDSVPVLERLLEAVVEPHRVDALELKVSASIGVTFFPQSDTIDADQLIRQSDQAMYEAKQSGKNRFHIFDTLHEREIRGRHKNIADTSKGLSEGEFELHYQPKVNLRSGEIIGVEALIRWQHPQSGLLSPEAFLPMIAQHPLMIKVGEWVLEEALSQIEIWKTKGIHIPISVNIDGLHLQQVDFAARLKAMLTRHHELNNGDLELEVLETSALEDITQVSYFIECCREIGITFAMDDFGTGYSSLTYLKRLPVDILKIDQSFVIDMLDDPEDLAILDGILGLANAFDRKVIAEGVATMEHAEMLLRMGCDLAQGYAIAKPMDASAFEHWVQEWRPEKRWKEIRPLAHDDLSALYAITEHRTWNNKLMAHLDDMTLPVPKLDKDACQFMKWFTKYAAHHPEHAQSLKTIEIIHETIHTLTQALIDDKKDINTQEKQRRIETIQEQRELLIQKILTLIDN